MSIQSGWNSMLAAVGGISALTSSAKQQEYQSILDAKKMQDEDIKQGFDEWMKIKGGIPEGTPQEEIDKLKNEFIQNRIDKLENKVYYKGMPKRMRKMFDKGRVASQISNLEESGDEAAFQGRVYNLQQQYGGSRSIPPEVAAQRAQEAAQVADAAPRNTMQGAMDAVRASQVELPDEEIVNPIRLGIGGGN